MRNNSAHNVLLQSANKLPLIHQSLRRSEIEPEFGFDQETKSNRSKGKVHTIHKNSKRDFINDENDFQSHDLALNNHSINKSYHKNEIFGITLTRNDNFIVSDDDDTLKNSLSFGKRSSVQQRL